MSRYGKAIGDGGDVLMLLERVHDIWKKKDKVICKSMIN